MGVSLPAFAAPPKYFVSRNPKVITATGEIVVGLDLGVDSVEGLQLMLKDGAIMELSIDARLEKVRSVWSNQLLAEKKYTSMLRHHPLTREFYLTLPGETTPIVERSLPRLLDATWSKLKLALGPVTLFEQAQEGSSYLIRLKIQLRHTEVPPWLSNTYLFWSWDVVEPLTIELPFIR